MLSAEALLEGPRPGRDDPEADRRWLDQRHQLLHRLDKRFDPRQILTMNAAERDKWSAARLECARAIVAEAARVPKT